MLFVAGIGLVVLVEFVYVQDQAAPGRMNTVFKTYSQVWALWAPAAGVALGRLATPLPDGSSLSDGPLAGAVQWRSAGTAFAVALVVLASLYGGVAMASHFDRGGRAASLQNLAAHGRRGCQRIGESHGRADGRRLAPRNWLPGAHAVPATRGPRDVVIYQVDQDTLAGED